MIMSNVQFLIKGLAGSRTLKGVIPVGGAKNAALKALVSSLLFRDEIILNNVPDIEDIKRIIDLLKEIGVRVKKNTKDNYSLFCESTIKSNIPEEISKKIRSSIVVTGPLLARVGKVSFPHPGGCIIGARPIDFFLEGFEKMGAKVQITEDKYIIKAPQGRLVGASLFLPNASVTVTETFMMTAVLSHGKTVIKNAALEPEIERLANFLNQCGARISGAGTPTITIIGSNGKLLSAKKIQYTTIADRIEAGSFLILAALAAEDVTITKCNPKHMDAVIEALKSAGVDMEIGKKSIRVRASSSSNKTSIHGVNIKTHEYPGFPTDLQAPMAIFLTQAEGESLVFETIFEGRLAYAESLSSMGADITPMDPHRMLIKGPTPLRGKELESPDLRAGLAFIVAAIIAQGESVVHNAYNIDRGYEYIEKRLQKIGVDIMRINTKRDYD